VNVALTDTRVVLISGARQAGKSTLVRIVAGDRLAERRDLDRAQDRAAATADPVGRLLRPTKLARDRSATFAQIAEAAEVPKTGATNF
jgi:ABC-type thiamine transport system ATPase subunit